MKNAIIYLIGHYGVGKFTIGKEIAASTGAKLFDNHLANNVIFSLVSARPIPDRVWDLISVVREQAFLAIKEFAPPCASFILTNCLIEGYPRDLAAFNKALALAESRNATFVPVVLTASDEAHAQRIPSLERAQRFKMIDVVASSEKRRKERVLSFVHPNRLELDTSMISPDHAARVIVEHAVKLAESHQL